MYLRPFASLDLPSTAPLDEEMRAGFRSVALDLAVMFVPPEVVVIPAIFIVVGAVTITRMAFRHHEKMAELQRGGGDGGGTRDPEIAARLARMEQAIDSMAVEMERVGEGQRFLTKVLSESPRLPERSP